jgi:hypothetical protein
LLPHPGDKIREIEFSGECQALNENFKTECSKLIESLLKPECLVVKKMNGKALKGSEFKDYLNLYLESFQSDELPNPKSFMVDKDSLDR